MKTDDLFLGIDLGTTSCKCFVFDTSLKQLGGSVREYPTIRTNEAWIEQDPNDWKQVLLDCIRDLNSIKDFNGQRVRGISVSSQGITFVPVDSEGFPIRNAITWLDNRASIQAEKVKRTVGVSGIRDITGITLTSSYVLPKLMWLYDNEPQTTVKMKKIQFAHDHIVYWLTGKTVTDHTLAAGSMLYDIDRAEWSEELCSIFGISSDILPDLAYAGETAGAVLPDIARELGISCEAVVKVGGQDQKCAYLGSMAGKSDLTVSLGTASAISATVSSRTGTGSGSFTYSPFLFKDTGVIEGVVPSAGASIKWMKDLIFNNITYDELQSIAEHKLSTGGTGLYFDPDLSLSREVGGVILPKGRFTGLSLSSDREDMALALYEGICFGITEKLLEASSICEPLKGNIILFGGGTADKLWCQMIADMTGRNVTICDTNQTASRGAAMLASGIRDAQIKDVVVISPDLERHLIYKKKAEIYAEIFNADNDIKVVDHER